MPVSDVLRSSDWYCETFGFEPSVMLEEADGLQAIVLEHPSGVILSLQNQPERANALVGFCAFALEVDDAAQLRGWCEALDRRSVAHSPIIDGHLGWFVEVSDPDGIVIELHTHGFPTADEP